jgi:hypothetical protein
MARTWPIFHKLPLLLSFVPILSFVIPSFL